MSNKAIEGERYKVIVRLDNNTIPEDGQRVRFETYEMHDLEGEYIASEGIISHDDDDFTFINDVFSWEPIIAENGLEIQPTTPNKIEVKPKHLVVIHYVLPEGISYVFKGLVDEVIGDNGKAIAYPAAIFREAFGFKMPAHTKITQV